MQTNKLTEKIEILHVSYSADTMGNSVPVYTCERNLFASISNQRGQTGFDQAITYTDSISFYLRFTPVLKAKKHILKYHGRLFTIENVTHIRRNQATVIDCSLIE
jgi:SPP1 family predicted phage head-tail adaptor